MNIDEQVATLMQGTEYGDQKLKDAMQAELRLRLLEAEKTSRKLRVYAGFDPRTTDLHLGHTIPMRKLRQFQDFGHEVIFLIGTYTSRIGDPSDHNKRRVRLSSRRIKQYAQTYAEQAFRVLDSEKTNVRFNDEWLSKITFAKLIKYASNFTIQQFLTRENFHKRWVNEDPIYLHETFYSIMQAYDAYKLKADVQVGGTDQLFNIMTAARKLMSSLGEKPNIGIIMSILPGTDGVRKMSKSVGNHIPLNTDAFDMFGKVMSVPDKAMGAYMRLVTRWTAYDIAAKEQAVTSGSLHPRDAKAEIAFEITEIFYGVNAANVARNQFAHVFQRGDAPEDMPTHKVAANQTVLDVLLGAGLAKSKSEGRRLIEQSGVKLDGKVLNDPTQLFPGPGVLQVGKRRFVKIEL